MALVNSTKHTQKTPRLRDRTDRAWFSCLLWHPVTKWSGSILSTRSPPGARVPEPAWSLLASVLLITPKQSVYQEQLGCVFQAYHSNTTCRQSSETKHYTTEVRQLHISSARYCTADVFPVPVSPTRSRGSLLLTATAIRSSNAVAGRVKANRELGCRCTLSCGDSFRCRVVRPTDMTPVALQVGGLGWYCEQ